MASAAAEVALRCQHAQEDGHVDLSNCELTKFPDGVFMLMQNSTVLSLNLTKNVLTSVSPKIPQRWSCIQELQLSQNLLSSLPAELQGLSNLRTLKLSNNEFNHLPTVIYSLPLERLVANNNHISQVAAEELKSMECLKFVDLRENPLSDALKSQLMEREDWQLLV